MPSAVWSGHLHFGLVVIPVRLLVAARAKTTRLRRLYRKPVNEGTSFPSFSRQRENHDSDLTEVTAETRSTPVRSGTNGFHASVFNYFRNDALDANDWLSNHYGFPKAPLRQNDFGGAFGGPILKDRTFFFLSYEGCNDDMRGVGAIFVAIPSRDVAGIARPLPKRSETARKTRQAKNKLR